MKKYFIIIAILIGGIYGGLKTVPVSSKGPVQVVYSLNPSSTPSPTITPSATPTPTPKAYKIIQKISETWKDEPKEDLMLALRISDCESGFNINAKNKTSTASGLFQFISDTWIRVRKYMGASTDLALRYNTDENIRTAYALFTLRKDRGLDPFSEWECYSKI